MICYLDRTFCSRPLNDCKCDEYRQMTPERVAAGTKWWGSADFPVATTDLCGGRSDDNSVRRKDSCS
jgi:hypothetical protein